MTVRTEYADLAIERDKVAARLAAPTIAERMARWFAPRTPEPTPDPYRWHDAGELIARAEEGR
jgi:hypothetical protein